LKLVIATPFYSVTAFSPYIVSLLNSIRVLDELKIQWDYYELSGDSYVDRAKNTLIHRFLKSDFTHILMIDSDLAWDVEGFARVLKASLAGAEVVGAAYPNKNNWSTYGAIPKEDANGMLMGRELSGMRLLDMWGIPGGFIIYSREAIERTRPNLNTYKNWEKDKNDEPIQTEYLECFRCNIEKDGGRVGEDIYFQLRYKEAGGIVWCEPNVNFQHFGVKGWEGNFNSYLLAKRNVSEAIDQEPEPDEGPIGENGPT
jgi:hypothetical protein